MTTQEILTRAKAAAAAPWLESAQKNEALLRMADALEQNQEEILSANRQDVEAARGTVSDVMLDRLALSAERIAGMAKGLREVAALPDPVGEVLSEIRRENGLLIRKVAVPMGVVAIIYESRPNVTSDAAALALKSGNVCILRSGKEALRSAKAIVKALQQGLGACGLDPALIQILEDPSRESACQLMQAEGYVDLLIPRGGAGLIRTCMEQASVPCIQTGTGICHVYVDASADFEMALNIIENAKTSRPSVCNAEEVLLVHEAAAERFLPLLQQRLCGKAAPHIRWSCAVTSGLQRSWAYRKRARRILIRNFWITFWRWPLCQTPTAPSPTLPPIPPTTVKPSSRKTRKARCASPGAWTAPPSM